jgi:predicted nucleic acid-binding protein
MNRIVRFVDTGYWIAVVNTRDQYHQRVRALAAAITGPFLTTEAVLLEVANALAVHALRAAAVALLTAIRADPHIEVVPLTPDLFERAFQLYAARRDKEWGLTDCISFTVMYDRGITEALAADQHFVQAGFRALLRA